MFKLYRADVELSCPRTPEPTSDGQWEECPAAGSIMHFQHLKTMSVRSTTPSPKNGWLQAQILQRPSSIDLICCIPHQLLPSSCHLISFQIPMPRSFILLTLIFIFFCTRRFGTKMQKQTSWHQGFKTDNWAANMQCFDVTSLLNASEPPGSRSSCGVSVSGRENNVFYLNFYQHFEG